LAAAAGIALNPLAIWSAAEGHNDALALAIVLAGFALAARSRIFWGACVVALAALVKAPGAIAAAALAAASWGDRARFTRAASGAGLGIAIVAALAIPLEYGVRAHLAPQGHYFPQFSLQYVSVPLAVIVIAALIAASTSSAVLRYLRMTLGERAALLVFAAWLAIPNPYPWYGIWLLPVAFLAWRSSAAWALLAASLLIAVRYYPDATTDLSRPLGILIVAIEFALPPMLLIAHTALSRRARRGIRTAAPGFAARPSP
jgi:hypothetical protein